MSCISQNWKKESAACRQRRLAKGGEKTMHRQWMSGQAGSR